ncbi:MAG: extracellular solute-binding protein [Acidobacteriota bacterium]|nr:extracellular solute-binding protein [Acidobacteriota bacterium]
MKTWIRIALTALAVLSLAVPAIGQDKQLVIWHSYRGQEKEALLKVVDNFNAKVKSDGYSVKPLAVPYDAYADKVTAAIPRGKGPDVFIFAQDRLGGWIEAGNTVEPLDFFLEDDMSDKFVEGTMDAMTYQDTVYGLPFNFKSILMIYNKKLVQTPPKTTGELVAMAKKMTNVAAGEYGWAYSYSDFFFHASVMNAFGGRVFDPGPKPVLNLPQNVKALETLMKWFKTDKVLPEEPSTALITALFNQNKAAIIFNGPWFLGEIDKSIDYGLANLPTVDEAGGEPMRPWMTIEGIYIAAPSKHKDEAFELVKHLISLETAKTMAITGRQTPANLAVYEEPEIKKDPIIQALREQAKLGVPMPNYPEMTMVWSPATTAMNLIVKETATPAQAMERAQKEVQASVDRLRGNRK